MQRKLFERDRGRNRVVWIFAVATLFILGLPLVFVLLASFRGPPALLPIEQSASWTLENYRYFYFDEHLYKVILPNTVVFALGSVAISCSIGLLLAWHFERGSSYRTTWMRVLVLAPLALPTPALAVAWIQLFGPNAGWINQLTRILIGSEVETGPFNIFSMEGIIWSQGLAGVPVAYLLLSPAVRAIRSDYEDASYTAGGGRWTTLRRVSMPLALPSIAGPILILFLIALEQVDFPYIFGPTAGINVLGTRIMWEVTAPSGLPNIGATSAASMCILLLATLGLIIHDRVVMRDTTAISTASRRGAIRASKWVGIAIHTGIFVYVITAFVIPVATLLVQSATGFAVLGSGPAGPGFGSLTGDDRFWRASLNTILVACGSAILGTVVGGGIAACSASGSDRLSALLNKISMSSIALPSVVVAFGVSVAFMSIPIGMYGSVWMLAIAYSYRISLSTRLARGAISQVEQGLIEAAATSGATWLGIQSRIVLPLIMPSILASSAFLFVAGVKEFIIPLMLYSPDNAVLSVLVLQLQQSGNTAGAAAAGLVMTAITLVGVVMLVMADEYLLAKGRAR